MYIKKFSIVKFSLDLRPHKCLELKRLYMVGLKDFQKLRCVKNILDYKRKREKKMGLGYLMGTHVIGDFALEFPFDDSSSGRLLGS